MTNHYWRAALREVWVAKLRQAVHGLKLIRQQRQRKAA